MDLSDWRGAAEAFDRAIQLERKNRVALACRGLCLLQMNQGMEEVKKLAAQSDDSERDSAWPLLLQAYLRVPFRGVRRYVES
jgi:hypothetical protein